MGREIRRVPKGWEHPRNGNGEYKPMFNKPYIDAFEEWLQNHQLWEKGGHPDQQESDAAKECRFYAEWAGNPPDVDYYNPNKWSEEEANCYQMYEIVSEGTPFSPVFDSLKELEDWLIDTKVYTRKEAREFCETGYAFTGSGYISVDSPLLRPETKDKQTAEQKNTKPKKTKSKGLKP
ncbi:hypothetical protein FXV77_05470 [Sphingobacterium phlebotomi]|uniref:Uncharacterized protein n=1 Tax=Sphingobacterium phlebotomi TaxID=2605433 RepID=A0A5D4HD38_9SPHI|nr:hypothetical protein [Sphingobacterium phlebotomi]TYR37455.1 hypothetical protein FXV77_05470 [Sphingobacterium phlebotomi]